MSDLLGVINPSSEIQKRACLVEKPSSQQRAVRPFLKRLVVVNQLSVLGKIKVLPNGLFSTGPLWCHFSFLSKYCMPISDTLKCIFIHIPKTGGQTICKALGFPQTLESLHGSIGEIELSHLTASMIRERKLEFNSYFRFTIVRHPLDRLVSEFYFSKQGRYRPYLPDYEIEFPEFVRRIVEVDLRGAHSTVNHLYPQTQFLYENNDLMVDYVGRFESMPQSLNFITSKLEISINDIPHINKSKHSPWRENYDSDTEQLARNFYAKDFVNFEY